MTIQDWGAIGELMGGVAVFATLVYLALQIRQNTLAIRLRTSHAVIEDFRSTLALVVGETGLAEACHKGMSDPSSISGTEKMRFWGWNSNFVYAFENAYIQSTQGALDPRHWTGMKRMVIDFTHVPGFREYWLNRKHWFSEDFQHFMESEILQADAQADVRLPGEYGSNVNSI